MSEANDETHDVTLFDEAGNPVNVVLIDGIHRLAVQAQILDDQQITLNPFPGRIFLEFLENGGSSDMAIDGSVTPVEFLASPPTGKIWFIHSITILIEDVGMNFSKYGGVSALSNGVQFKIKTNGEAEVILSTITRNGDYYVFVNELVFESSTTDILVGKLLPIVNSGSAIKLAASDSEFFKAVVNDDLSSLIKHAVLIRGYEVDE